MGSRLDRATKLRREGGYSPNTERHFRDLFENAGDFMYTIDLRGKFTSVNRMGERLTGYSSAELLASNIRQIVAPESLAAVLRMMGCTVQGASPTICEVEVVAKAGHRVPVEISSGILYRGRYPVGFHGIARDISARREAQVERAQAMGALDYLRSVLRGAQSLEQVYSTLGEHAPRLVHADHAMLALLDPDRRALSCVHASGASVEPGDATFPVAETVFAQVIQTGASYLSDDVMRDHVPARPAWLLRLYQALGPVIVVALRSEHGTIGALAIGRVKGGRPFAQSEIRLLQSIAEMAGTAISRASLHHNLEEAYFQLVLSLARAMDAKDAYTRGHSERLVALTEALARDMSLSEEEVKDIRWATVLHDIGKIGAPDNILFKPGPLTEREWEIMRQHPIVGEQILLPVKRMRGVAKLVRHHQERWDGTGYPDRLRAEAIPLGARIIAVADAFGAMTDARPYKDAVTQAGALEELTRCAGTQFDPDVVAGFCRLLRRDQRVLHDQRPARRPKAGV